MSRHEKKTVRILIADDEINTREGIYYLLDRHYKGGYELAAAEDGAEALDKLKTGSYDLLITDIRMPGLSGIELVEGLKRLKIDSAVVFLTGYADFDYARQGLSFGVSDYLLKPVDKARLLEAVDRALKVRQQRLLERQAYVIWYASGKAEAEAMEHGEWHPVIAKAMCYMEEHLSDDIQLKEVAGHVHVSPSYFSSLFKEKTGIAFSDCMIRLRHRKAKELLVTTAMDINLIADETGYQSSSYFIRVFRQLEGVTPRQYRELINRQLTS